MPILSRSPSFTPAYKCDWDKRTHVIKSSRAFLTLRVFSAVFEKGITFAFNKALQNIYHPDTHINEKHPSDAQERREKKNSFMKMHAQKLWPM